MKMVTEVLCSDCVACTVLWGWGGRRVRVSGMGEPGPSLSPLPLPTPLLHYLFIFSDYSEFEKADIMFWILLLFFIKTEVTVKV